ncbi:hypothetical protein B5X24_HaOG210660 [Helicoverpa armigera]|nr:hypothetical protein B5X24_HaOG210660 [Helicoverpa armigera]
MYESISLNDLHCSAFLNCSIYQNDHSLFHNLLASLFVVPLNTFWWPFDIFRLYFMMSFFHKFVKWDIVSFVYIGYQISDSDIG